MPPRGNAERARKLQQFTSRLPVQAPTDLAVLRPALGHAGTIKTRQISMIGNPAPLPQSDAPRFGVVRGKAKLFALWLVRPMVDFPSFPTRIFPHSRAVGENQRARLIYADLMS